MSRPEYVREAPTVSYKNKNAGIQPKNLTKKIDYQSHTGAFHDRRYL